VQGVLTERKECVTESVSIPKIRRDNMKPSLCKEYKETGARRAKSSARIQTLCKDLVQGVHRSEIRLSVEGTLQEVEETEKENARRERRMSLREILRI
jgi:hypothetical protein